MPHPVTQWMDRAELQRRIQVVRQAHASPSPPPAPRSPRTQQQQQQQQDTTNQSSSASLERDSSVASPRKTGSLGAGSSAPQVASGSTIHSKSTDAPRPPAVQRSMATLPKEASVMKLRRQFKSSSATLASQQAGSIADTHIPLGVEEGTDDVVFLRLLLKAGGAPAAEDLMAVPESLDKYSLFAVAPVLQNLPHGHEEATWIPPVPALEGETTPVPETTTPRTARGAQPAFAPGTGLWKARVFPALRPVGRAQSLYLAQALKLALEKTRAAAAHGPTTSMDPSDPAAMVESLQHMLNSSGALSEMKVWDVALRELARQSFLQCEERGLLIERARARIMMCVQLLLAGLTAQQRLLLRVSNQEHTPNQPNTSQPSNLDQVLTEHRAVAQQQVRDVESLKAKLAKIQADCDHMVERHVEAEVAFEDWHADFRTMFAPLDRKLTHDVDRVIDGPDVAEEHKSIAAAHGGRFVAGEPQPVPASEANFTAHLWGLRSDSIPAWMRLFSNQDPALLARVYEVLQSTVQDMADLSQPVDSSRVAGTAVSDAVHHRREVEQELGAKCILLTQMLAQKSKEEIIGLTVRYGAVIEARFANFHGAVKAFQWMWYVIALWQGWAWMRTSWAKKFGLGPLNLTKLHGGTSRAMTVALHAARTVPSVVQSAEILPPALIGVLQTRITAVLASTADLLRALGRRYGCDVSESITQAESLWTSSIPIGTRLVRHVAADISVTLQGSASLVASSYRYDPLRAAADSLHNRSAGVTYQTVRAQVDELVKLLHMRSRDSLVQLRQLELDRSMYDEASAAAGAVAWLQSERKTLEEDWLRMKKTLDPALDKTAAHLDRVKMEIPIQQEAMQVAMVKWGEASLRHLIWMLEQDGGLRALDRVVAELLRATHDVIISVSEAGQARVATLDRAADWDLWRLQIDQWKSLGSASASGSTINVEQCVPQASHVIVRIACTCLQLPDDAVAAVEDVLAAAASLVLRDVSMQFPLLYKELIKSGMLLFEWVAARVAVNALASLDSPIDGAGVPNEILDIRDALKSPNHAPPDVKAAGASMARRLSRLRTKPDAAHQDSSGSSPRRSSIGADVRRERRLSGSPTRTASRELSPTRSTRQVSPDRSHASGARRARAPRSNTQRLLLQATPTNTHDGDASDSGFSAEEEDDIAGVTDDEINPWTAKDRMSETFQSTVRFQTRLEGATSQFVQAMPANCRPEVRQEFQNLYSYGQKLAEWALTLRKRSKSVGAHADGIPATVPPPSITELITGRPVKSVEDADARLVEVLQLARDMVSDTCNKRAAAVAARKARSMNDLQEASALASDKVPPAVTTAVTELRTVLQQLVPELVATKSASKMVAPSTPGVVFAPTLQIPPPTAAPAAASAPAALPPSAPTPIIVNSPSPAMQAELDMLRASVQSLTAANKRLQEHVQLVQNTAEARLGMTGDLQREADEQRLEKLQAQKEAQDLREKYQVVQAQFDSLQTQLSCENGNPEESDEEWSASNMCSRDMLADKAVAKPQLLKPSAWHRAYNLAKLIRGAAALYGFDNGQALMERVKAVPANRMFSRGRVRRLMLEIYKSKMEADASSDKAGQPRIEMQEHVANYLLRVYGDLKLVRNYYAVLIASADKIRVLDENVDMFLSFIDGRHGLPCLNLFLNAWAMLDSSTVGMSYPLQVLNERFVKEVPVMREDMARCFAVTQALLGPLHPTRMAAIVRDLFAVGTGPFVEDMEFIPNSVPRPLVTIDENGGPSVQHAEARRRRQFKAVSLMAVAALRLLGNRRASASSPDLAGTLSEDEDEKAPEHVLSSPVGHAGGPQHFPPSIVRAASYVSKQKEQLLSPRVGGDWSQQVRQLERAAEPLGWIVPRLEFLSILVQHYVAMETQLNEFCEALFIANDRHLDGRLRKPDFDRLLLDVDPAMPEAEMDRLWGEGVRHSTQIRGLGAATRFTVTREGYAAVLDSTQIFRNAFKKRPVENAATFAKPRPTGRTTGSRGAPRPVPETKASADGVPMGRVFSFPALVAQSTPKSSVDPSMTRRGVPPPPPRRPLLSRGPPGSMSMDASWRLSGTPLTTSLTSEPVGFGVTEVDTDFTDDDEE